MYSTLARPGLVTCRLAVQHSRHANAGNMSMRHLVTTTTTTTNTTNTTDTTNPTTTNTNSFGRHNAFTGATNHPDHLGGCEQPAARQAVGQH